MRSVVLSGVCLVVLAVGCGTKLNDERTMSLAPGDEKTLTVDPASREQKVRVQIESPGAAVNVYCFLQKDQAEAEKAVQAGKSSDKVLGSQTKKEEADFEVTVPANQPAVVMLTSASSKTANVKIKLTNR